MADCLRRRAGVRTVGHLPLPRGAISHHLVDLPTTTGATAPVARQSYASGDSTYALVISPTRGTVVLVRQFRLPPFLRQPDRQTLIELPGGRLDGQEPDVAVRREVEEETGLRLSAATPAFDVYMCPTFVVDRVHLFVADLDFAVRVSPGGGRAEEGEAIEVLELQLDDALAMAGAGQIADGKTLLMLQYARAIGLG